jgi:hypothetical protein
VQSNDYSSILSRQKTRFERKHCMKGVTIDLYKAIENQEKHRF